MSNKYEKLIQDCAQEAYDLCASGQLSTAQELSRWIEETASSTEYAFKTARIREAFGDRCTEAEAAERVLADLWEAVRDLENTEGA